MKKVLSLVLVLSLILGTFSTAFASFSDVVGEASEDAVNVLEELGVITGYEDGTYKPGNIVTRAEMAVLVIKALGLDNFVTGTNVSSFTDMDGYGWAQGYIAYAQSMGVISGYGDGTFRPGNTVSYDEAATMLVAALGYTPQSLAGTWPASYVTKAKALGILDDIVAGSHGANRGDIAIMIYQSLNLPIGRVDGDNRWYDPAKENDNNKDSDTMLKRLGAAEYKGGDKFVLTYAEAEAATAKIMKYVGAYMTAYENKDGDIMAIKEVKSSFLTGEMKSGKFKADGVEYTISGAKLDIYSDDGAALFKNADLESDTVEAVNTANNEFELFSTSSAITGQVTLAVDYSGKTIKEVYSVMQWIVDDHDLYNSDLTEELKDDHSFFGLDFPEDDNGDVDEALFALLGVDSLDDISKDNVVYVFANADDKIVRVEVGTETVKGKISKKTTNDKDYTIGGKVYTVSDITLPTAKVGDEVEARLDYTGKIYEFDKISGKADNYAVVIELSPGSDRIGLRADLPLIKMILADGTVKTFEVDLDDLSYETDNSNDSDWDDFVDDTGVTETAGNNTYGQWSVISQLDKGSIIKYGTNSSGQVDTINQVKNSTTTSPKNITKDGYYNGRKIDTSASIFTFDGTWGAFNTKADDYGTTTLSKILDSSNVKANYVEDDGIIEAMVVEGTTTGEDDIFGIVVACEEIDSDNADYVVDMIINGNEAVTYESKTKVTGSDLLSMYKVKLNAAGVATLTKVTESTSSAAEYYVVATGGGISVSGNVVSFDSGYAKYAGSSTETGTTYGDSADKLTLVSSNLVVYKQDGTSNDLKRSNKTAIGNTASGKVYFLDTSDDEIYDIVVILN